MRENRTYEKINVGDEASIKRVLTADDLYIFANASGNLNPLHLPKSGDAASEEIVAPSMWVGALFPRSSAMCFRGRARFTNRKR